MPELPEVHTIAKDMNIYLTGYLIEKVDIKGTYRVFPDKETFIKGLEGKKIKSVSRIAKFIIVELDSGKYLVFHLAMTGRILLRNRDNESDKFVRITFRISQFADTKKLVFCDMRMFGKVQLLDSIQLQEIKSSRGIDPLDETLSSTTFLEKLRTVRTNIKNVLLNQKIFAGIGNIYANEALYRAGIHPETTTKEITKEQAEALLEQIRAVLKEGIKNRGSTLPDKMYVDLFGKEGSQQDNFKVFLKDKCLKCFTKIEYIKLNGRGSYFCPTCQKKHNQEKLI